MFWGPVYAKAFDGAGKKMEYAEYIVASLKGYVLEELKTWSVGSSYDDAPIFSIGDGVDKAEVKIAPMVLPDNNGTVAFMRLKMIRSSPSLENCLTVTQIITTSKLVAWPAPLKGTLEG